MSKKSQPFYVEQARRKGNLLDHILRLAPTDYEVYDEEVSEDAPEQHDLSWKVGSSTVIVGYSPDGNDLSLLVLDSKSGETKYLRWSVTDLEALDHFTSYLARIPAESIETEGAGE